MAPHIYTIADDSYNSLIDYSQSQSIVISGESGTNFGPGKSAVGAAS